MKLSVVIVNYNVRHFLKQCLNSVIKASEDIDTEIFVVDNNSADGSVEMIKKEFPAVKLIANDKNVGFSKANNQAIKQAKGEYILLLNPDTFVKEDTFRLVVEYMDKNPDVGGLGVKMIDGQGDFLPESKRGLPTPMVAFYKMSGLTKLFPKSKVFARYYLGHLDENEINDVEILSGAFMLLRKKVLDEIGLLDETFFMYGEDIDLSYRVLKAGYRNVYFPDTQIVHYKGESTKRGSLNYVVTFYKAMKIFVDKHYSSRRNAFIFKSIINLAIVFRAALAILSRFVKKVFLPLLDFTFIYGGYLLMLVPYWEKVYLKSSYPDTYLYFVLPAYALIWIFSLFIQGGYDSPVSLKNVIKGSLTGTVILLILYSLLSENLRFSRALILIGTIWVIFSILLVRIILWKLKLFDFKIAEYIKKRVAVVGTPEEFIKIKSLLKSLHLPIDFLGFVSTEKNNIDVEEYLGKVDRLQDIIKMNKINEVIFSANSLSSDDIIRYMMSLSDFGIEFKTSSPDGLSVIGSNSVNTNGEIYVVSLNSINSPKNKRLKRMFDATTAFFILLFSPFLVFFQKNKLRFFKNTFDVLTGKKTWVGFYYKGNSKIDYANIKQGIFTPMEREVMDELNEEAIEKINLNYAQNYSVLNDFMILTGSFSKIGNYD